MIKTKKEKAKYKNRLKVINNYFKIKKYYKYYK